MTQPGIGRKTYLWVWAVLLLLVLLTTLLGRLDLGPFSAAVAIAIATAKAALIVIYFMQAKIEPRLIWVIIAGGIIWMLILMSNTLGDYITRGWLPFPGK